VNARSKTELLFNEWSMVCQSKKNEPKNSEHGYNFDHPHENFRGLSAQAVRNKRM